MAENEIKSINGRKLQDEKARQDIANISVPTKTSELENDSNFITDSEVDTKIAEAQLGGGEVDLSGYVTKETGNASQITFSDGQTFQAKLDAGTLKGPKGDKGDKGEQGLRGEKGDTGADGLITNIVVNETTYTHSNGTITLPNYPTVPTNVSELTNDANYASETFVNNKIAEASLSGGGSTATNASEILTNYIYRETPNAGKGCVVFMTDDGHECDLNFRTVFNKYGKKFCIAVIPGWVGTTKDLTVGGGRYMNWSEIKELYNEGHEILSHTYTHTGLDANDETDIKDILDAINAFKEQGINVESIVYPYNRVSDIVKKNILKYHRCGLGYGTEKNTIPLNSRYHLKRLEARGDANTDYTVNFDGSRMLQASQNNEMLVYMMHSHYSPSEKQTELVEAMVKYCVENNIDICTVSEALDRFQNIIQIGGSYGDDSYWCLAPDKNIYSKSLVRVTDLTLSANMVNKTPNSTYQLSFTILPSDASDKSVTWKSDNETIATVDNNGLVTINSTEGTATITCTSNSNKLVSAQCIFNVSQEGSETVSSIVLDNAIGWIDACDGMTPKDGKWAFRDKIDNSKYLMTNSGTDAMYSGEGSIRPSGTISTCTIYNGLIDFSQNTFTLGIGLKIPSDTNSSKELVKWYDSKTAGTFIRLNSDGVIYLYKSWQKLAEITIPGFTLGSVYSLTIRVNGTTVDVFNNGAKIASETLADTFSNFTTFTIDLSCSEIYFHYMYMYNIALTDNQVTANATYESSLTRIDE